MCEADSYAEVIREYLRDEAISMTGKYQLQDFSWSAQLLRDGKPIVVENILSSDMVPEADVAAMVATQQLSIISVPIIKNDVWVGVLSVSDNKPRHWTKEDVSLVRRKAERTWDAVHRVKAEDALRKSEHQLKQLLAMRDEFISIAGHELKSPVTSIKTYAEIVQEGLEESGETHYSDLLSKMNAQLDRLTILINDLLDTTKISEGQLKLDPKMLDLNELLYERIEEIRRTSNHKFELRLQEIPPVIADRLRIGQVIANLLSNAIKYSPKGTTITVASFVDQDSVKVTVQDEGYGIPEEDVHKIFERFFRVTANKYDSLPGIGLGLYITAQIIHKHNGIISVQSIEGKGSTFSFTLPYNNKSEGVV